MNYSPSAYSSIILLSLPRFPSIKKRDVFALYGEQETAFCPSQREREMEVWMKERRRSRGASRDS